MGCRHISPGAGNVCPRVQPVGINNITQVKLPTGMRHKGVTQRCPHENLMLVKKLY